jgi:hypothetical protein
MSISRQTARRGDISELDRRYPDHERLSIRASAIAPRSTAAEGSPENLELMRIID